MKLELPCPILLRSSFSEAARRLGITVEDVEQIACGNASLRAGRVLNMAEFYDAYPGDSPDDFTGDQVFPADLKTLQFEVPRDPSQLMTPPISGLDRAAAAAWRAVQRYRQLRELHAPNILLAAEQASLREACDSLATGESIWQPMSELMTGAPAEPGAAGEEDPMFGLPFDHEADSADPADATWLADAVLVTWPYSTLVFEFDGTIRDAFPSRGLRAVGGDSRFVGLVSGGPVARSGDFSAEVFVRDTQAHRWLARGSPMPPAIPRYVAGTIGDVKWAVVVDTLGGVGYRTSPLASGDQSGESFNSACGTFVWDRDRFVLEAATGTAVLDVNALEGRLLGFAKAASGWRFLMADESAGLCVRLKNETNTVIRTLDSLTRASALSPDGARLLEVSAVSLVVTDADSGLRAGPAFDLSGLTPSLRLPRNDELWQHLAATFGTAGQLAGRSDDEARAAIQGMFEPVKDDALAKALEEAVKWPKLPERVPVHAA